MGQPFLLKNKPHPLFAVLLASAVVWLNTLDACATLHWIRVGIETANPFMAYILAYDSLPFLALRTFGIALAVFFLFHCAIRRYAIAMYGLIFLAAAYLIPMAVHVYLYAHTSLM